MRPGQIDLTWVAETVQSLWSQPDCWRASAGTKTNREWWWPRRMASRRDCAILQAAVSTASVLCVIGRGCGNASSALSLGKRSPQIFAQKSSAPSSGQGALREPRHVIWTSAAADVAVTTSPGDRKLLGRWTPSLVWIMSEFPDVVIDAADEVS